MGLSFQLVDVLLYHGLYTEQNLSIISNSLDRSLRFHNFPAVLLSPTDFWKMNNVGPGVNYCNTQGQHTEVWQFSPSAISFSEY